MPTPLMHKPPGNRPTATGINLPIQYCKLSVFNVNNNDVQAQQITKRSGSNPLTARSR